MKVDIRTHQGLFLIAKVAREPNYKKVGDSNIPYLSVGLVTYEAFKKKDSEEVQFRTTWHNCVAWNKMANYINVLDLKKGDFVQIVGKINNNTYIDGNQQTHNNFEVVIDKINLIARNPNPKEDGDVAEIEDLEEDAIDKIVGQFFENAIEPNFDDFDFNNDK